MESNSDPLRKIKTKHAPEATADIGSALKAARVKKGASLDAVGQHTRIPKKFLDALENNRFEEFPALAYLRGFLKSYCDYLEVDFEPLWKQVVPETPPPSAPGKPAAAAAPAQTPAPAPVSEPTPMPAPVVKTPAPRPTGPRPPQPRPTKTDDQGAPPPPALPSQPLGQASHGGAESGGEGSSASAAGALIAVGIASILIGLWLFLPRQKAAPAQAPVAATPAALQPLKPPTEPQLTVLFRRDMWVSISLDGVEKFQGRVPQGSKQEWKAKRGIVLRASDPQALKLTLNGAPYALPVPEGDGTFHIEAP